MKLFKYTLVSLVFLLELTSISSGNQCKAGSVKEVIVVTDLRASTERDQFPAVDGQLNNPIGRAWLPSVLDDSWIEADIGFVTYVIGIVTQGKGDGNFWVKTYNVNSTKSNNTAFDVVQNQYGTLEFEGNNDTINFSKSMFCNPTEARIIRIIPVSYKNYIALKFGLRIHYDTNECASFPCQNGGQCLDQMDSYMCACIAGFNDTHCETNINECASSPCQNGGQCLDQVDYYTCTCIVGFTGTHCETNINECASSPCQNGGQCFDQVDYYTCTCIVGFTGTHCETKNEYIEPVLVAVAVACFTILLVLVLLVGLKVNLRNRGARVQAFYIYRNRKP